MIRRFISFCFLSLSVVLAGCGGSGGGNPVLIDPALTAFQVAVAADEARRLEIIGDPDADIRGIPGTVWASVPTTGQAIFRGTGLGHIGSAQGDPDLALRGDVFLTFSFGTDDINGQMIRMSASDGTQVFEVADNIDFLNGDIGGVRDNAFKLDYIADLEIDGADFALDGDMDGLLRGTRFGVVRRSAIKALSAIEDDGVAMVDGEARPFDLVITAETN